MDSQNYLSQGSVQYCSMVHQLGLSTNQLELAMMLKHQVLFNFPIKQEQLAIPDGAFARDVRDTCWHKGHSIAEDYYEGMMVIASSALGGIIIQGELNSTDQGRKLLLAECELARDGNVRAFSRHEGSA